MIQGLKYDDASWHYGGDFPDDLPDEAGATHIGMFAAWACLNGLAGTIHTDECPEDLQTLIVRGQTPGAWFLAVCDGKLIDEDFNEEGNAFTAFYYGLPQPESMAFYLKDYERLFQSAPSLYHVADSWLTFDRLAPVLEYRFNEWRRAGKPDESIP